MEATPIDVMEFTIGVMGQRFLALAAPVLLADLSLVNKLLPLFRGTKKQMMRISLIRTVAKSSSDRADRVGA
jgi:hypothetical protein